MKISLNWLKEYVEWNCSVSELAEKLTMSGTEVEAITQTGVNIPQIVTAKVVSSAQHPNADRLSVCQVTDGVTTRQIVCGAKNYKVGDVVPLALPGAQLPDGLIIKSSKLRGEKSEGMMCSAIELGLGADASGLLILPENTPLGRPLSEIFPGDTVLEVEVTPNRADLLSYRGIAQELAALGMKTKPFPKISSVKRATDVLWNICSENLADSPRYTIQYLTDVKIAHSPDWLKKYLEAIGARPINNVVDITNFVLFETGQPLHAFDAGKIKGKTVQTRLAKKGEKLHALDGKIYELTTEDLVIADGEVPIGLAGIMGGELSGITEDTTSVLLESALFNASRIRATARRHGMNTDASYRFERGIDPQVVDIARERAADLIIELAGAKRHDGIWETAPYTPPRNVVSLRNEKARAFMGAEVSDSRISQILSSLGCESDGKNSWKIPTWRPDLAREVDLIEEIVRVEGLDNIRRGIALGSAPATDTDLTENRNHKLRIVLTSLGFFEIITPSFLPQGEGELSLLNPMNEENACMRSTLLSGALPCVARNLAREQRDIRMFEIGRVYKKDGREKTHLLLLGTGMERPAHWTEPARAFDAFSLKGALEALCARFPEIKFPENFSLVDSSSLKKHSIKVPVFASEIILPSSAKKEDVKFQPLPQYPAVTRDLAFVVNKTIPQQQILDVIRSSSIPELESVACFDYFYDKDGKKLPADKKSLAYSLTYRSRERTLNESEVSRWEAQIIDSVRQSIGAELRT
ncbi:MAG: phenylalanine--tRNA ligase subunit beta [Verrucomicrobiota bacterium]